MASIILFDEESCNRKREAKLHEICTSKWNRAYNLEWGVRRDRRASRHNNGEDLGKGELTLTWWSSSETNEVWGTQMRRKKSEYFAMCHAKHFSIFSLLCKISLHFKPFIFNFWLVFSFLDDTLLRQLMRQYGWDEHRYI